MFLAPHQTLRGNSYYHRTDKKVRNRVAQQAFRERHAAYVRDLERRLAQASHTEDARSKKLTAENVMLRSLLIQARDDLRSVIKTQSRTLDAIGVALADPEDLESAEAGVMNRNSQQADTTSSTLIDDDCGMTLSTRSPRQVSLATVTNKQYEPSETTDGPGNAQVLPEAGAFTANSVSTPMQWLLSDDHDPISSSHSSNAVACQIANEEQLLWPNDTLSVDFLSTSYSTTLPTNDTPNENEAFWSRVSGQSESMTGFEDQRISPHNHPSRIWSHEYQMGSPIYREALTHIQQTRHSVILTNSNFSDHLNAIKECFVSLQHARDFMSPDYTRFVAFAIHDVLSTDIFRFFKSVSVSLSLFNSLARPEVLGWYAPTKYYQHIAGVVMWQIRPCRETYVRLATRYRPTALQMMEDYPAVIDWCPFASVRDRLITLHAANPCIDNIICNMATSYVVEADLCDLIQTNGRSTRCFVRVWDIIQCLAPKATCPRQTLSSHPQLPAPNIASLFTKEYAIRVFKKLHMDEGIALYKLDPAFFQQYPELLGDDHDIIGKGLAILSNNQTTLPGPSKLDEKMLTTYKHFTSWSIDVLSQD
jgi:hypothetical protein